MNSDFHYFYFLRQQRNNPLDARFVPHRHEPPFLRDNLCHPPTPHITPTMARRLSSTYIPLISVIHSMPTIACCCVTRFAQSGSLYCREISLRNFFSNLFTGEGYVWEEVYIDRLIEIVSITRIQIDGTQSLSRVRSETGWKLS